MIWGYVAVAALAFLVGAAIGYYSACKDNEEENS